MLPRTLRGRLAVIVAAVVVASVGGSLVVAQVLVRRAVRRNAETQLSRLAGTLVERRALLGLAPASARRPSGVGLETIPADGAPATLPGNAVAALRAGGTARGEGTVAGQARIYAARSLPNGRILIVSRPERQVSSDQRPFISALLLAGAAGALLAALAGWLLARSLGRPISRVASAAAELAAGRQPDPLPAEGPEELRALAGAFDGMARDLRRVREAEHLFLLSVSHELKTPLTSIRGYAEALEDGALPPAEAAAVLTTEAGRLERLVGDLLALARLEQPGFGVARDRLDLVGPAEQAVRRATRAAGARGVELRLQAPGAAPAVGDADRVLQALSNLLDNALRVTPRGGSVTVRAAPGLVEVLDTGPGIRPADLPRAFERFYLHARGGDPAVGSGLGLAIVAELARAMGGRVEVASPPGDGAHFSLILPTPSAAGASSPPAGPHASKAADGAPVVDARA